MAYTLTLTHDERQAIDWIGYRYSHGDSLYSALWLDSECQEVKESVDGCLLTGEEIRWDTGIDLTFLVSESVAWTIRDLVEQDGLACFAPELCSKLHTFCEGIV